MMEVLWILGRLPEVTELGGIRQVIPLFLFND